MCSRFGWDQRQTLALATVLGLDHTIVNRVLVGTSVQAHQSLMPGITKPQKITDVEIRQDAKTAVATMEAAAVVALRGRATPQSMKRAADATKTAASKVMKKPSGTLKRPASAFTYPITVKWHDNDTSSNRNAYQCKWYGRALTTLSGTTLSSSQRSAELKRVHKDAGTAWDAHQ
jgi:hypothetical protein